MKSNSPTSAVQQQFLAPLQAAYEPTRNRRQCPVESDWDWLVKGVERVVGTSRSGRDFLQVFQPGWVRAMAVGTYFETLASTRRLAMVRECATRLRQHVDAARPSPLADYPELDGFDLYAGDGHYLVAASHDVKHGDTAWATGHFFALNLKSQSLTPLTLAQPGKRKLEPDIRALKRQSVAQLRFGAPKRRKVLWVWDKAAVDLPFWLARKTAGIYFLSLRKDNLCLTLDHERPVNPLLPINQGVTADRVVCDRRGLQLREITFCNPCDGQVYVYLTTEMTLPPGLLVLLYKTRWEIEKVFDETKTKLQEKKSWATSPTAKVMQAHFMAITHNLLLLLQDHHDQLGVTNTAEVQRRQKRLEQQEAALAQQNQTLPLIYKIFQRFTQATFKLIRWLRTYWLHPTPLPQALRQLQALYAKL